MKIKNGLVFCDDGVFRPGSVYTDGALITHVSVDPEGSGDGEIIDAGGAYIIPGLVDIHIHGAMGADFCDGEDAATDTIARYLCKNGVTSFLGTTMAFSEEILCGICGGAKERFGEAMPRAATLQGVNMEGPFFAMEKKGAQNGKYIQNPDIGMFDHIFAASGENIRMVDVAPELPGSPEFIAHAAKKCTVSVAHTAAGYDAAERGFLAGADHVTHLFNAMPPFGHRDPGVVGAAARYARYVEVISDGIHLHPAMVCSAFRLFAGRVCLISDSMRACGMPNGTYTLGGQTVYVTDGKAVLEDGTIAGSATCLMDCMRRTVSFGVPLEQAVQAATLNPARSVGLDDKIGSLTRGKRADIVLLNSDLSLRRVILAGEVQIWE